MLSQWQKQNIVHGFLNMFNSDIRLNWNVNIDKMYQELKDGHHGMVQFDGHYYTLIVNNQPFQWSEL